MTKGINQDFGKLLIRISVGGLMIFHGIYKLIHGHDFIKIMLEKKGLPSILWLGVPIGEIIAPIFIILGIFTRISSLLVAFTMFMTIYLVHEMNIFNISENGGLAGELNIFYLLASLSIFFLGSGKYSLYKGNKVILM
ncbi:DoxX family protein [Apibacter adventoris]|uniref:DoxX family protein n=1 Tax=Apibacter adventoris TaxID=1679466 RepID=UPI001FED13F6|nr:DoxX family protein [Apibacter adventoris]